MQFRFLILNAGFVLLGALNATCAEQLDLVASTADFYVATDGKDAWSGTLSEPNHDGTVGPFAALARAIESTTIFTQTSSDTSATSCSNPF